MSASPRTEAAAFIIWCDAKKHGWDRTVAEIATEVRMSKQRVRRVLEVKGWLNRVRVSRTDGLRIPNATIRFDEELDDLTRRMPGF